MFSDKLLSLLKSFSKYDLNRFKKFLISPYFNEQEGLVHLFELCNEALRDSPEAVESLDKHTVWKKLFPKEALDEAHLRRMASELTLLAHRFLTIEYQEQNPNSGLLDLQKVFDKPRLKKHLAGIERQLQKNLGEPHRQASSQYLSLYRFHWNVYNRAAKTMATADYMSKLLPANEYLDAFYLVQKMKLYLAWLSYRNFRATELDIELMEGFWDYLEDPRFADIPLLQISRQLVRCLSQPQEEQYFDELMELLREQGDALAPEDLRESYQMAQNYCALKINQGKTQYYRPVFELYKSMIHREVLLENQQLSEAVYKNIITISLQLGEYDWAVQFVRDYADFLPLTIQENARSYNLANLYFHQKKYDEVIQLLGSVEYSDVTYSLGAKLLLLRTYYETSEYLALDSLLDSVRIFLRRNRFISKNMEREFKNFLNFLKRLAALDHSDKKAILSLEAKLLETPAVISKKWLLEKINELK
ncbi:MAG: hypothetical protein R2792_02585 [Saprospiraceae bacterium]